LIQPDGPIHRASLTWHGGQVATARQLYPAAPEPWLDLSTGIAPWPYPIRSIESGDWQRLPDRQALLGLEAEAAKYFGMGPGNADQVVAVPGSDIAIRLLARLIPAQRVAIAGHSYGGYRSAWPLAKVMPFEHALRADLTVCANPNNPDGAWIEQRLLQRPRNARVVDEAFADADASQTLLPHRNGATVLRSFGKFFGLAGVRLGFVIADRPLARDLRAMMGDWPISGPAIAIATQAYADREWQAAQRVRLREASSRLLALLVACGLTDAGGTGSFRLCETPHAAALFDWLCRCGILVRPFAERPHALRFGLPAGDAQWQRLELTLTKWSEMQ
jgi:cobalamin biosynthetic protein CobC